MEGGFASYAEASTGISLLPQSGLYQIQNLETSYVSAPDQVGLTDCVSMDCRSQIEEC